MSAALKHVACICGLTAYPTLNMDEKLRMQPCCPSCGRVHHELEAAPERSNVVPIALRGTSLSVLAGDPVALIQSRVAFLEAELSKAAEYTKEVRRLRRMLKAAGVPS